MYLVEIINAETKELEYSTEVFASQDEAEQYVDDVCEDRHGLEGIVISLLIEKAIFTDNDILQSANVVYHT